MLVLVLALLTVSYASSMRAYFQQRAHLAALTADIAEREANIADLEREKTRWQDPAYVQQMAHQRFGYVMPGEKSFIVLDANGDPLGSSSQLEDPAAVVPQAPTAWWSKAWGSVELAGHPPPAEPPPVDRIGKPTKKITSGNS